MQGGIRSWWLLAACVLEAAAAVIYFRNADHGFHLRSTVPLLGRLALATGACVLAAGVRQAPRNWLLALNGLAFGALGLVMTGVFGSRIGFRLIALLLAVTALSLAAIEWKTGRTLRLQQEASRFAPLFVIAAVVLLLFGVIFGVIAATGLRTAPGSNPEILLLGYYFAFSSLSVLGLAWRTV